MIPFPENQMDRLRVDLKKQFVQGMFGTTSGWRSKGSRGGSASKFGRNLRALAGILVIPFLSGCGGPVDPPVAAAPGDLNSPKVSVLGNREKQVAFLNQIRSADPDARTIDRAMINEQNELGLILDRTMEMEKIPALMRLMLTKMAAQFPGEDLTILAYTPSSPPRRLGTARLNSTTRDMTYTPD